MPKLGIDDLDLCQLCVRRQSSWLPSLEIDQAGRYCRLGSLQPCDLRYPMKIDAMKVACSNCNLRELCLPVGLSDSDMQRIDQLVASRRTLKRGEMLFRAGDRFEALFAVRTGFFKTRVSAEDGRDQVTGFQMAGELLGLDGISSDRHSCDAVALEDSQVCQIPYGRLGTCRTTYPTSSASSTR